MKFAGVILQGNTHRLTELDFWYDIILSRCSHDSISCRKVLPSNECSCSASL